MTSKSQSDISAAYLKLLNQQQFVADELDYVGFDHQKSMLQILADHANCGVSVFDMYKKSHIFYSPNFGSSLGYDLSEIIKKSHDFWDHKIHHEDYAGMMQNGILLLKLFYQFSDDEKTNYKLISEYRILNAENKYVRVIEQQQVLQLDNYGNIWLTLSIIDISPNQEISEEMKSQLFDFKTGKILPFDIEAKSSEMVNLGLTNREIQILKMVKEGLLSKEISAKLNISLNTVNTHRQRVLKKLRANNSMEAVIFASKYGLL
ncbi:LuxR C-terminal-related transcriptional regulator [Geofilum sp. OHC36d9]|uniref:LuxR C-terminal-related transcriptional regulator n=1 Tax=Geofilum sp. OHC36d9 TaxID=3458413 RepID=UPI0040337B6E